MATALELIAELQRKLEATPSPWGPQISRPVIAQAVNRLRAIQSVVDQQAGLSWLWHTDDADRLREQLRRLHAVIEGDLLAQSLSEPLEGTQAPLQAPEVAAGHPFAVPDVVCPVCGGRDTIFGYGLYDESGQHQHTRYACTRWVHTPTVDHLHGYACDWRGWFVPEAYRTKTGRTLTNADVEVLADEAEQGYDVEHLKHQPNRRSVGEADIDMMVRGRPHPVVGGDIDVEVIQTEPIPPQPVDTTPPAPNRTHAQMEALLEHYEAAMEVWERRAIQINLDVLRQVIEEEGWGIIYPADWPGLCSRCHQVIKPGTHHTPFNGNQMAMCSEACDRCGKVIVQNHVQPETRLLLERLEGEDFWCFGHAEV